MENKQMYFSLQDMDQDGKILLPPNKKLIFIGPENYPFYSKSDDFWDMLTESDIPPFEVLKGFIAKLPMADPDDIEDFVRSRAYFAEQEALLRHIRTDNSLEGWLMTPVIVNLGLDIDADFEYTLNSTYPSYGGKLYDDENNKLFDCSSIMWLTRRQGYSRAELREALHWYDDFRGYPYHEPEEDIKSPYLRSVYEEVENELTSFNQLVFFVLVPFRDLLLMTTMQRWGKEKGKWPGYILLSTNTACGFCDFSEASGSVCGIKLEKKVKLPLNIVEIMPDGAIYDPWLQYYTPYSRLWREFCILYWGLPRRFRKDAASMGVEFLPPSKNKH